MKIDECTPEDVHTVGGGEFPPCVGLTSCALPEAQSNANIESSQTGMSTRSVHILSKSKVCHWFLYQSHSAMLHVLWTHSDGLPQLPCGLLLHQNNP